MYTCPPCPSLPLPTPSPSHRYLSQSPHTHTPPYKPLFEHSVTLSSVSKLTNSHESAKEAHKPSDDDYLVVDEDLMSKSDNERDSSMPESLYSSPSPTLAIHAPVMHHRPPAVRGRLFGSSPTLKVRYSTGVKSTRSPAMSFDSPQLESLEVLAVSDNTAEVAGEAPKSYAEAEVVFQKKYDDHFKVLMIQLIKSNGLSLSWLEIVQPLIMKATQTVRTDVFADDIMDINEYVRVKKLPCGIKSDSSLNHGVVCTKNVTHKKMSTSITNPTILLLKCAFDFQRRENQLSSFDTLHLQENKYLQNLVDKVKAFKPGIILVQKSVSRLALEDLYDLGIVVVVNVKPGVMERIARCTQGEILTNLDQLFFDVRLGTCAKFYLRNFTLESGIKKTLMYFDKCDPKLGCVITLQGGTNRELKKVKKVTQFGLHLAYNSLLESSFLLDEYAWPGNKDNEEEGVLQAPPESYAPTSSTPEFPLYPSLPHPLDVLPPAEVVKRLEALGVIRKGSGDELAGNVLTPQSIGEEGQDHQNPQLDGKQKELAGNSPTISGNAKQETVPAIVEGEDSFSMKDKNEEKADPKSSPTQQTDSHSVPSQEDSTTGQSDSQTIPDQADSDSIPIVSSSQTALSETGPNFTHQDPEEKLKTIDKEVLANLGEREFQTATSTQLLSISPSVKFTVPYLQTAQGCEADIRQYLPSTIYWSYQFKPTPKGSDVAKIEENGDTLEMGLTKVLVEEVVPPRQHSESIESSCSARSHSRVSYNKPSYKSVSEHPLTTSFLLLKANTNEMRAALADFRSRAGLSMEDNNFFFKSAKVAADYRLHLQNVFNKYKQFDGGRKESSEVSEEDRKEEVGDGKGKQHRFNRPSKSSCEKDALSTDAPAVASQALSNGVSKVSAAKLPVGVKQNVTEVGIDVSLCDDSKEPRVKLSHDKASPSRDVVHPDYRHLVGSSESSKPVYTMAC